MGNDNIYKTISLEDVIKEGDIAKFPDGKLYRLTPVSVKDYRRETVESDLISLSSALGAEKVNIDWNGDEFMFTSWKEDFSPVLICEGSIDDLKNYEGNMPW